MAGLLKQLQKQKAKREGEIAPVILQSPSEGVIAPETISPTREIDRRYVEAEMMLNELVHESTVQASQAAHGVNQAATGLLKVVRNTPTTPRSTPRTEKANEKSAESAPPEWTKNDRKLSPAVEYALEQCGQEIISYLRTESEFPRDVESFAQKMVTTCCEKFPQERRIGRRDQEVVELELISLMSTKGPLQQVYEDPAVSRIFLDSHSVLKVERRGKCIETPFSFRSTTDYLVFLHSMLRAAGYDLNSTDPVVDCIIEDRWRSRVNAIDSSVLNGDEPRATIRIPRPHKVSFYDILQTKTLPATLAAWLAELVSQGEANILIVGPVGSGRTLMTTALLSEASSDERVIVVEDVPEISISAAQLERLNSQPFNPKTGKETPLADLVRAATRRGPNRIILGEVTGREGLEFLRAMERGYQGCIASIYGDFALDGIWRFHDLIASYENSAHDAVLRRVARSLHIIIAMQRVDGKPCVAEVCEVQLARDGEIILLPLVQFEGISDGKRLWRMMSKESFWVSKTAERGVSLKAGPGLLPLAETKSKR